MNRLSNVLVGVIAIEHIGFLIIEMFLWTRPFGQKLFQLDYDFALKSETLAANQGLYNGFLAAGLIWSLIHKMDIVSFQLKIFFLGCVLVAGLYGWYSVGVTILYFQAIPAFLGLILVLYQRKS